MIRSPFVTKARSRPYTIGSVTHRKSCYLSVVKQGSIGRAYEEIVSHEEDEDLVAMGST